MGFFRKGQLVALGQDARYKIRITTEDGAVLYWHKGGELHTVEEDVARVFVTNFKPELFEVMPDGSFSSPVEGQTKRVARLDMERV